MLAISGEEEQPVRSFLEKNGYSVRTSAGSQSSSAYGVSGIPASFLIGPDGKVVWSGHPASLSKGTIKEALKGAKPRDVSNFLAYWPEAEYGKSLESIVALSTSGKLGKALTSARQMAAAANLAPADAAEATALASELTNYVGELTRQVETMVEARDLLRATTVLETLGKELGQEEEGKAARERLSAIRADKALVKEIEALDAWDRLKSSTSRLSSAKARDKYKEFAAKWTGTRAGDIARSASLKSGG